MSARGAARTARMELARRKKMLVVRAIVFFDVDRWKWRIQVVVGGLDAGVNSSV